MTAPSNGNADPADTSAFADMRPGAREIDPEMTLLIPTLGRSLILESFRALLAGTRWPGHIVVVDQGSNPELPGWLEEITGLGIRTQYIRSGETGRARGLNRGLREIESRFVAVTDDDCLPDERWLERLGRHLRAYPERVFTGRVVAAGTGCLLTTVLSTTPVVARRPSLLFDRLSGGNLAAAMAVFARVGLFDDDACIAFSEDGEWAYRALRAGVEIAYVPDCSVGHQGWRTLEERVQQYERYARSHAAFFGKHIRRGDLFMTARAAVNLLRSSRRWLVGRLRGDAELAAHGRAYTKRFLPGLVVGLRSARPPPTLDDPMRRPPESP